jgi:hypothetical protein
MFKLAPDVANYHKDIEKPEDYYNFPPLWVYFSDQQPRSG